MCVRLDRSGKHSTPFCKCSSVGQALIPGPGLSRCRVGAACERMFFPIKVLSGQRRASVTRLLLEFLRAGASIFCIALYSEETLFYNNVTALESYLMRNARWNGTFQSAQIAEKCCAIINHRTIVIADLPNEFLKPPNTPTKPTQYYTLQKQENSISLLE